MSHPHNGPDDNRSQDPRQRHEVPADRAPIPDEQDIVTVAPPFGVHLEENPAAADPLLNPDLAE